MPRGHASIKWILVVCLLIGMGSLILWNEQDPTIDVRGYLTTGYNDHFTTLPNTSFPEYINQTKAMIKHARDKAGVYNSSDVIEKNSPFMLLPNPKVCPANPDGKYENGILMLHGLGESPYFLRPIAENLSRHCFVIYALLLPGHGTVPGDFLNVTYQDWLAATDYGIQALQQQVHHVVLFGYSVGGLLALIEGLKHPDIKAIVAFAPAIQIAQRDISLIGVGNILSKLFGRFQWVTYDTDEVSPVEYFNFATNAIYQTWRLQAYFATLTKTNSLNMPLFFLTSYRDVTIDPSATIKFFEKTTNPKSRLIVFRRFSSNSFVNDPRATYYKTLDKARDILSMSHVSLLLPESDPLYGRHGQIRECWFYVKDSVEYQHCMTDPNPLLGSPVPDNLQMGILRRLTFNPFFAETLAELNQFLACVTTHAMTCGSH